jgi:hypothetical protein
VPLFQRFQRLNRRTKILLATLTIFLIVSLVFLQNRDKRSSAPTVTPPPAPSPSTVVQTSAEEGPRQVTYAVTGTKDPGDIINITFTDASGQSRTQANVNIPWSLTLKFSQYLGIGSVVASSSLKVSKLNCSITASDGTVLAQQSDNSPVVSCL